MLVLAACGPAKKDDPPRFGRLPEFSLQDHHGHPATLAGLKGKICRHWALNPHPALIPAIEAGWVESIHSFGSELGMEEYIRARSDVFFTGADG